MTKSGELTSSVLRKHGIMSKSFIYSNRHLRLGAMDHVELELSAGGRRGTDAAGWISVAGKPLVSESVLLTAVVSGLPQ